MSACWQERGWHYSPRPPLRGEFGNMVAWLRKADPESILEVGAGWGRIYSYLKPLGLARHFAMCDFVDSMRQMCFLKTGILPDHWDGYTLPYRDNHFDLVLSFSTLQHVPPEQIGAVFAEHVRVSDRWLFIAVWAHGDWPGLYDHDYPGLFKAHSLEVAKARVFGKRRRAHWLLEKRHVRSDVAILSSLLLPKFRGQWHTPGRPLRSGEGIDAG